MKKLLVVFVICLLVCGCRKTENNVTINVYENKDPEVKEEIKNNKEEAKTEQKEDRNFVWSCSLQV